MAEQTVTANTGPSEISLSQVVIRCGCDDPLSHAMAQLPCPTPREVDDRGVVAHWKREEQPRPFWQRWVKR